MAVHQGSIVAQSRQVSSMSAATHSSQDHLLGAGSLDSGAVQRPPELFLAAPDRRQLSSGVVDGLALRTDLCGDVLHGQASLEVDPPMPGNPLVALGPQLTIDGGLTTPNAEG